MSAAVHGKPYTGYCTACNKDGVQVASRTSHAMKVLCDRCAERSSPGATRLIDAIIPAGAFAVLFGPSGHGKTFLTLDWAYCVATGIPWYGRQVKAGHVVYVAAEGHAGLRQRRDAWKRARSVDKVHRTRFLPQAVNLLDKGVQDRLRRTIAALPEAPGADRRRHDGPDDGRR
jgi:hypothetical protein